MKVILTENQAKTILLAEQTYNILSEANSFDSLKRKVRNLVIAGVAISAIMMSIKRLNVPNTVKQELEEIVYEQQPNYMNDPVFKEKVAATQKYMEYALANQGFNPSSTSLSAEELVKASEETGFDLPFLLAAAHLESCFGATPRAKRTNSVFSVGAYDNGKDVCHYSNPNESILPYINLLKKDYLRGGKGLMDLLGNGKFVNFDGKRYASNKNYEGQIKSIRNRIIKMYPVLTNLINSNQNNG